MPSTWKSGSEGEGMQTLLQLSGSSLFHHVPAQGLGADHLYLTLAARLFGLTLHPKNERRAQATQEQIFQQSDDITALQSFTDGWRCGLVPHTSIAVTLMSITLSVPLRRCSGHIHRDCHASPVLAIMSLCSGIMRAQRDR